MILFQNGSDVIHAATYTYLIYVKFKLISKKIDIKFSLTFGKEHSKLYFLEFK